MKRGFYRHYKGGLYFVLGFVYDANNNGICSNFDVLYYSFTFKRFYRRNMNEFNSYAYPPIEIPGGVMLGGSCSLRFWKVPWWNWD